MEDEEPQSDPISVGYSNLTRESPPDPRYYDGQLRVLFFIGGVLLIPVSIVLPNLFWGHNGLAWHLLRLVVSGAAFLGWGCDDHSFI